MALDYLREVFAGRDTVPTVEKRTHFLGDLRIDRGALLATGGRDVLGGPLLSNPGPLFEGDENRRRNVYRAVGTRPLHMIPWTCLTWRTSPD